MDHQMQSTHLAGTLEHLCRHWEEKRKATESRPAHLSTTPPLTIALSREAGILGTSVGREVGARLGWPVYDHELLEKIAQEMGLRTRLLESVDERRLNWLEETFDTFLAIPHVGEIAYVKHLLKTILALGAHGECLIVGRGAAHILPAETTLRVHLIAPLQERIRALSVRLGIPSDDAAYQVGFMDRERTAFIQEHFHKDPTDLRSYDLVFDFSRFGVAGCVGLIVEAVHGLQTREGSKSHPAHSA